MGKIAAQEVCKMEKKHPEKKHPNNLQEMRKRAGYKSAEAFAKYMGMPYGTYRNYEQGVRSMSFRLKPCRTGCAERIAASIPFEGAQWTGMMCVKTVAGQ